MCSVGVDRARRRISEAEPAEFEPRNTPNTRNESGDSECVGSVSIKRGDEHQKRNQRKLNHETHQTHEMNQEIQNVLGRRRSSAATCKNCASGLAISTI